MKIITYGEIASPTDIQEIHEYAEVYVNLQETQIELHNFSKLLDIYQYSEGIGTVIMSFIIKALKFLATLFGSFYFKIFAAIIASIALITKIAKQSSSVSVSAGGGGGGGGGGSSTATIIKEDKVEEVKTQNEIEIKDITIEAVDPVEPKGLEIKSKRKIRKKEIRRDFNASVGIKSKIREISNSKPSTPLPQVVQEFCDEIGSEESTSIDLVNLLPDENLESLKAMRDGISQYFMITDTGLLLIPRDVYDIYGARLLKLLNTPECKKSFFGDNTVVTLTKTGQALPNINYDALKDYVDAIASDFNRDEEKNKDSATVEVLLEILKAVQTPDGMRNEKEKNLILQSSLIYNQFLNGAERVISKHFKAMKGYNSKRSELIKNPETKPTEIYQTKLNEYVRSLGDVYNGLTKTCKSNDLFIEFQVPSNGSKDVLIRYCNDEYIDMSMFVASIIGDSDDNINDMKDTLSSKRDALKQAQENISDMIKQFSEVKLVENNKNVHSVVNMIRYNLNILLSSSTAMSAHLSYTLTALKEIPNYIKISNSIKDSLIAMTEAAIKIYANK